MTMNGSTGIIDKKNSVFVNVEVAYKNKSTAQLSWETKKDTGVWVYVRELGNGVGYAHRISASSTEKEITISDLKPGVRYVFEIVPKGRADGVNVAERQIPFDGVMNFRDLGGYTTLSGHRTKWGHVYRSSKLFGLTDSDQMLFKQLGIRCVFDFRVIREAQKEPDRLPTDGSVTHFPRPIIHGEFNTTLAAEKIQKGDTGWLTDEYMINGYKQNIDKYAHIWGEVINKLADSSCHPLVFHCNVGKDRAGTCAALILLALGVPEETIIYDYSLTNIFLFEFLEGINEKIRSSGVDPDELRPYLTASPSYITALLSHIRETYGTVEHYLITKAGVKENVLLLLKEELLE